MTQVKRIFMTGEAGYHNLGDEAMALASAKRLKQYFPEADLVATGLDPLGAVLRHQARIVQWPLLPGEVRSSYLQRLVRKYAQKAGADEGFLDPLARPFEDIFQHQYATNDQFKSVVKEIEQADLVFDMGHGALNDIFGPFMLCFLYYIAGRLQKPLFISGQSIGPLWRRSSIGMLKNMLPVAHTIGLRDVGVSKNILIKQVGLNTSQVHMAEVGDDTLDLVGEEPEWNNIPTHINDLIQCGEFIAVQWRSSDYSQQIGETSQIISFIGLLETIYKQTGLPIVFVPLSWESRNSDIVVAMRIQDYLSGQIPFQVIWNYLEAPYVKWILGRAKFGIGLSYHFHVFSLSQGVPTIALFTNAYYEIKLKGAMAAFGHSLAPLSYPLAAENPERIYEAIDVVMGWNGTERARLLRHASAAQRAWHVAWLRFVTDHHLLVSQPMPV